jgi:hypothetical protein
VGGKGVGRVAEWPVRGFGWLSSAWVCALALNLCLGGCMRPSWTEHRMYDVRIDFEYAGRIYHQTWTHECIAYKSDSDWDGLTRSHQVRWIVSRWPGFARRLPDGSGVLFKFRLDPCGGSEAGQILFGRPAPGDVWRMPYNNATQPIIDAAEAKHPEQFLFPNVYWLDNAASPTRVEACVYAECSQNPKARVRVLGISGGPSDALKASNPMSDMPGLKAVMAKGARFVGYACWAIPVDDLPSDGDFTPDHMLKKLEKRPDPPTDAGSSRSERTIMELRIQHFPLLNAWTLQRPYHPAVDAVNDLELSDPEMADRVYRPRTFWSRDCARSGDTVTFQGARHDPGAPFIMTRWSQRDQSPTAFVLPDGERLDSGPKFKDIVPAYSRPNDPMEFSAAAAGQNRTIYISEAHLLTFSESLRP